MPCNPAIGGTGKGHLVRELDALGGQIARAADAACIQYRVLNKGKGPAVWSLRAQADRREYQKVMKRTLEGQENLWLKQAEVTDVLTEDGAVRAVRTASGGIYAVRAAVIATGTHLEGAPSWGKLAGLGSTAWPPPSPHPEPGAAGAEPAPLQDGHAPPVHARSVDFSRMERQEGDRTPVPFSFETAQPPGNRAVCWLTYTNEQTHAVIRANLDRAPLTLG